MFRKKNKIYYTTIFNFQVRYIENLTIIIDYTMAQSSPYDFDIYVCPAEYH